MPEDGKKADTLPPRLMIAVGVPAYKTGIENGTRTFVDLLGVASTDVPVEDIDKLTLPYKVFKHFQTYSNFSTDNETDEFFNYTVGSERLSFYC